MDTDTYDSERRIDTDDVGTVRRAWTDPDDHIAETVAELVGTVLDRDPIDLVPLYDYVDTDALDLLFRSTDRTDDPIRGIVEFNYAGCRVRVFSDGEVVVEPNTVE